MKILLAVDGSPRSDKAVDQIARRPWPAGSEIRVLTAVELPLPPTPEAGAIPPNYFEELDRAASEQARSILKRTVTQLRSEMGSEVNITGKSVPGPPRVVILEEGESWGADLIVFRRMVIARGNAFFQARFRDQNFRMRSARSR